MAKTLNELSNELKDYILDAHSNYKGLKNISVERYHNLKIYMRPDYYQVFHVIIRIGISEAVLILPDGLIYTGGLGMDEKFVQRWLQRDTVLHELSSLWKIAESGLT